MPAVCTPSHAQPAAVKGEFTITTTGGYARMLLTLEREVKTETRLSNGILLIAFSEPVQVAVEKIPSLLGGYIGAARRDPDGRMLRLALSRPLSVNAIPAAERIFIDLLPATWKGPHPGLPSDVVEELARRAKENEQRLRTERLRAQAASMPPILVRIGQGPTFTRLSFELPENIAVTVDRERDAMNMTFEAPLNLDFSDVRTVLPDFIEDIDYEQRLETTYVRILLKTGVDIRTFREDRVYVVDFTPIGAKLNSPAGKLFTPPDLEKPSSRTPASPPPTTPASPHSARQTKTTVASVLWPYVDDVEMVSATTEMKRPSSKAAESTLPPVPATPAPPVPAAEAVTMPAGQASSVRTPVTMELRRDGDALRLVFPFQSSVPMAVFQRGYSLWIVFETETPVDVSAIAGDPTKTLLKYALNHVDGGSILQFTLTTARMVSVSRHGQDIILGLDNTQTAAPRRMSMVRTIDPSGRLTLVAGLPNPGRVFKVHDADVGDDIYVVTATPPSAGVLRVQDFVEFSFLPSTIGLAVRAIAEDLMVDVRTHDVAISRRSGLILTDGGAVQRLIGNERATFDPLAWQQDRDAPFLKRSDELIHAAAEASDQGKLSARMDLARFYLAHGLYTEADGIIRRAMSDSRQAAEDPAALIIRAIALLEQQRAEEALTLLAMPQVANHLEAQMWRAAALVATGKIGEARILFRTTDQVVAALPPDLQARLRMYALRAAVQSGDHAEASRLVNDLDTLGVPADLDASFHLLSARLTQAMGREEEALVLYNRLAGDKGPAGIEARLRRTILAYKLGQIQRDDMMGELESLALIWRGDATELETMNHLSSTYLDAHRYRDAFRVMKTALTAHPGQPMTDAIQDRAAVTFEKLFLEGQAATLPAVEALALYYDFKELTPVGRRGDEMIRRLTDRLIEVDLVDEAAELLQHQVDKRLQGAARAQVAARLAAVRLTGRDPQKALQALRTTRLPNLPNDLREKRLLLEARALSDLGRHDLALDVVSYLNGREVERLRSDIFWNSQRWSQAGEAMERVLGDRWQEPSLLSDSERADIIRAAIAYALGEDSLGIERLRSRYVGLMAQTPDAKAFDIVTSSARTRGVEFREIARDISAIDTLRAFLQEVRLRYPDHAPDAAPQSPRPQS